MTIEDKVVLGTAQFGSRYGITNVSGKPSVSHVFQMLELAWSKGIRRFDTAPRYGSESLLGEFVATHKLQSEVKILTKLSSLGLECDYENSIINSVERSLDNINSTIEVLFFHNPEDSNLLLTHPSIFERLLTNYPIGSLGVSVYEEDQVFRLQDCNFDLSFQFPFNVLDRRFEQVKMPQGRRYARSIFLQGLLASSSSLRPGARSNLSTLQNKYHNWLDTKDINPIAYALSFVFYSNATDYFLIGVDSITQINSILNADITEGNLFLEFELSNENFDVRVLDPRTWN